MKQLKKVISIMLAICMLITAMPETVFAVEEQEVNITAEPVFVKVPNVILCEDSISTYELDDSGNPVLKDSNEEKWIDRLANLPEWAINFYDWMVENSDGDGDEDALINPRTGEVKETENGSVYTYQIATIPEQTLRFEFPIGSTEEEALEARAIKARAKAPCV